MLIGSSSAGRKRAGFGRRPGAISAGAFWESVGLRRDDRLILGVRTSGVSMSRRLSITNQFELSLLFVHGQPRWIFFPCAFGIRLLSTLVSR